MKLITDLVIVDGFHAGFLKVLHTIVKTEEHQNTQG